MDVFLVFRVCKDDCYSEYVSVHRSFAEAENFVKENFSQVLFSWKDYHSAKSGDYYCWRDSLSLLK